MEMAAGNLFCSNEFSVWQFGNNFSAYQSARQNGCTFTAVGQLAHRWEFIGMVNSLYVNLDDRNFSGLLYALYDSTSGSVYLLFVSTA